MIANSACPKARNWYHSVGLKQRKAKAKKTADPSTQFDAKNAPNSAQDDSFAVLLSFDAALTNTFPHYQDSPA